MDRQNSKENLKTGSRIGTGFCVRGTLLPPTSPAILLKRGDRYTLGEITSDIDISHHILTNGCPSLGTLDDGITHGILTNGRTTISTLNHDVTHGILMNATIPMYIYTVASVIPSQSLRGKKQGEQGYEDLFFHGSVPRRVERKF